MKILSILTSAIDASGSEFNKRKLISTTWPTTTITATSTRNELNSLIDEANRSHIPIQITCERGNAVLVSYPAMNDPLLEPFRGWTKVVRRKNGTAKPPEPAEALEALGCLL